MIVSHEHRFIFIKTHKTAGTSLEFALTRFAGEDGIVTPFTVKDDERDRRALGFGEARNYRTPAKDYRNHMPASQVRAMLGEEIFASYFKFAVERNSYDKAVSMHAWMNRDGRAGAGFEDFVCAGRTYEVSDFDRYCIDGVVAMDAILPYEDLQTGLDRVAETLKLPGRIDLSDIRRKSGYRGPEPYQGLYTARAREAVEVQFAREIRLFGFGFGDLNRSETFV